MGKGFVFRKKLDSNQDYLHLIYLPSTDFFLIQFDSKKSVKINGAEANVNAIQVIGKGAIIKLAKADAIYYNDLRKLFLKANLDDKVIFEVKSMEYTFPNGQKGLHKLNFTAESGMMLGIMGGSGAGKSTLLNLLNGNLKPEAGQVLINGHDLHKENAMKQLIGFVSQDDLLLEDLSVFDNLYYSAKLNFPNLSNEALSEKVNTTLQAMGLLEVKHLKVGNPIEKYISGGQRKRLNIALEYIRETNILFVDEPTSGLSSHDSERIMELLKNMSLTGKLVFVVIHQPSSSSFKLFDQLLIVDLGGYPVYYGNPLETASYFREITAQASMQEIECDACGNVNPEQIFDIIEQKVVDEYGQQTSQRKVSPREWYLFFKALSA
ncbi:MAG: ATP-binding cassette domain-containing protein [Flavobacteriales bacterium]